MIFHSRPLGNQPLRGALDNKRLPSFVGKLFLGKSEGKVPIHEQVDIKIPGARYVGFQMGGS